MKPTIESPESPLAHLLLGAVLALFVALAIHGCDQAFVAAVGPNEDVVLFTDFPERDAREDALVAALTERVWTPVRPERPFDVEVSDSTGFRLRRDWRTLVFLIDLRTSRWGSRICRKVLGEDRAARLLGQPFGLALTQDRWALGQTLLFLHAPKADAFVSWVRSHRDSLLQILDEAVIQGLGKTLYVSGEQKTIQRGICARHGFEIRIPGDFMVQEQEENRFVRIVRMQPDEPVSFLFVYYQEQTREDLDPGLCIAIRDTLGAVYLKGEHVDQEPNGIRIRERSFQGRRALEIYGLYQCDSPPMGGPFKMVCFHEGGRLYVIDMAAYNPPGRKMPQLRMLEAIARTFRICK